VSFVPTGLDATRRGANGHCGTPNLIGPSTSARSAAPAVAASSAGADPAGDDDDDGEADADHD
jgi:hypothetical protein